MTTSEIDFGESFIGTLTEVQYTDTHRGTMGGAVG